MKARLLAAAGLGVVLQVALIVTGFARPLLVPVTALSVLVCTAAVWALGRRAAYARGRERLTWGIVAASGLVWLPGAVLTMRSAVLGSPPGAGSGLVRPESLLGGIAAALILVALLAGPNASLPWRERLRMALDGAMAAVALFVPAWAFLLHPAYRDLGRSFTTLVAVVVGVQIATIAIALVLLSRQRPEGANAFTMLAGAAGAFGTLTMLFCTLVIYDGAVDLTVVAPLSVLGAFMLLTMTWFPMPMNVPPWSGAPTGLRGGLPYLPVLGAFAVTTTQPFDQNVLVAMSVLFGLVLLRQFLALHSNGRLLAEVEEKRAELQYQATHDHLTGLTNRTFLYEHASGWRSPVALMILDLDGFKQINDRFGHAAGDEVLVEVARVLTSIVPSGHVAARLGGDEFAVVLHPAPPVRDAAAIGERIIEAVAAKGRVGISLGLAYEPTGRATLGMMLSDADAALYKAKAAGKGRLAKSNRIT
ncbi:GGDEF domain-containing protein [Catenuloplanes japonicus]|uniref:GGDEF domain-containing protein n=1 Tax=Catenuloplanes japonicus TaxID=33876 RepID=UPI00052448B5|nr:GGDEF domain-containing protein [Catenuloplanes japonicus]